MSAVATIVKMKLTKTTRRTFRFDAEEIAGSPPPHISNIYVDQAAFQYKPPKTVTVTVEAGDGDF